MGAEPENQLSRDLVIAIGIDEVRQFDDHPVVVSSEQDGRIGDLGDERGVLGGAGAGRRTAVIHRQRRCGTDARAAAVLGKDANAQHPVGAKSGYGIDQRAVGPAACRRRSTGAGVIHDLHGNLRRLLSGQGDIGQGHRAPGLAAPEGDAFLDGLALGVAFRAELQTRCQHRPDQPQAG